MKRAIVAGLRARWRDYGVYALIVALAVLVMSQGHGCLGWGSHPLQGERVPDATFALLDGGDVTLSSHRGSEVVLLDFWASWCPPCRKGLPIIAEVAEKYRDRGVVAYAVNVGEDPELIQHFLRESGVDIPVALDPFAEMAEAYQVSGIPTTVLVGKDGVAHRVHVGVVSAKRLTRELDAILKEAQGG